MDAVDAVAKLHEIDPGFREICEALYPGLDPRQVADAVYGVSKAEPSSSDAHVNGSEAKRRDMPRHLRRIGPALNKVDTAKFPDGAHHALKAVRDLSKSLAVQHAPGSDPKRERRLAYTGLAATGVATLGAGHAIKESLDTVKENRAKVRSGVPAAGLKVPKMLRGVKPRNAAILAGAGWLGLHGTEAVADALNARAQVKAIHQNSAKRPRKTVTKSWDSAAALIVESVQSGLISKSEGMALGEAVWADLAKSYALGAPGRMSLKLGPVKPAPKPVGIKAPAPVLAAKPAAPAVAKPAAPSGVGKALDIEGEISKVDADKQQCFGWCSVVKVDGKDVVDKQNDMIDIDDVESAAYDYMLTSRKGGDMHRRAPDGGVHHAADVIESFVLTPEKIAKMGLPDTVPQGWWIGMQVNDPGLWDDVKSGRKTKFSIHGTGTRTAVMVDD